PPFAFGFHPKSTWFVKNRDLEQMPQIAQILAANEYYDSTARISFANNRQLRRRYQEQAQRRCASIGYAGESCFRSILHWRYNRAGARKGADDRGLFCPCRGSITPVLWPLSRGER